MRIVCLLGSVSCSWSAGSVCYVSVSVRGWCCSTTVDVPVAWIEKRELELELELVWMLVR